MAKVPANASRRLSTANVSMGPKLVGFGAALFVVTRIVNWLPLSIVGTWINSILWPVLVLSIAAGAGLIYLKSKRAS